MQKARSLFDVDLLPSTSPILGRQMEMKLCVLKKNRVLSLRDETQERLCDNTRIVCRFDAGRRQGDLDGRAHRRLPPHRLLHRTLQSVPVSR